jgi:hypothetical protein
MDETDNNPSQGPEVLAAETARMAAEQLRAQARAQFQTPTWIGPPRTDAPHAASIPAQADAEHDELESVPHVVTPSETIPQTAHWAEREGSRLVAGILLFAALGGLLTFLALTVITQSAGAIIGLVACAVVAVLFRGALMSASVTQVDLGGSVLRVRRGGVLDVVDLANPMHVVELVGSPDQPTWRLRFEAVDGHVVELGPTQVDPHELHRIVEHYQVIAQRKRHERARRFNR